MGRLRGLKSRCVFDHVMKIQHKAGVLAIGAKSFRLSMIWIENRKNMANLAVGVARKLLDSADGDQKWSVRFRHAAYLPL